MFYPLRKTVVERRKIELFGSLSEIHGYKKRIRCFCVEFCSNGPSHLLVEVPFGLDDLLAPRLP